MTLYEYVNDVMKDDENGGEVEIKVIDSKYNDIILYFYKEENTNKLDNYIDEFAKMLDVVTIVKYGVVITNISDILINKNKFSRIMKLFECSEDSIKTFVTKVTDELVSYTEEEWKDFFNCFN